MNKTGLHIKRTREKKGLTQEYLALELNMAQSNYQRLEKDDNRISVVRLKQIAKTLGVSTSYLLEETESTLTENREIIDLNFKQKGELYDFQINALQSEVASLKDEIQFLRSLLKHKFSM